MGEMRTRDVMVTWLDDAGRLVPAEAGLYVCPECDGEAFMVYRVGEAGHTHLQCVVCDASYCDGSCTAGAAGERSGG